ncbi:MAG: STAS domain-containing protein [Acidimicrobiales bacterium]
MTDCAAPGFSVCVRQGADRTVVALGGELDLYAAPQLRERLMALTDGDGRGDLVLDLAELAFIDSTGLGVVVEAAKSARARGRDLVLSRPTPSTYKVLEITGLHQALRVERTAAAVPSA